MWMPGYWTGSPDSISGVHKLVQVYGYVWMLAQGSGYWSRCMFIGSDIQVLDWVSGY